MTGATDVVIVAAARTPLGRISGALAGLGAPELGGVAIAGALERSGIDPALVDAVIIGQALQAGVGQGPARQAAIAGGIGWRAHCTTVNKVCLSGLTAIIDAARLVRSGEADVVVAGGMESMTNAPYLLPGARGGFRYGNVAALDSTLHDGLTDAFVHSAMGACTDHDTAEKYPISRAEQDEIAAASHQRAQAGWDAGVFDAEVVPVTIPDRKGSTTVARDEGIRPDTTAETLARLRPAFSPDGSVTAGNASQLTDGAAATVLTTRAHAQANGWQVLATVRAAGQVAGPDTSLHAQPANAIRMALDRQGWSVDELDHVEINEAFAVVVAQSARDLGLDRARVNPNGGAIALGHPLGASGARLAVHAAHRLVARGGGRAAVALCGGGGQGEALLLEA
ncbi:acetyl-CoA C-acetyltransferase [Raineyella antarctica]|uniref:Probable acetyl-CoA acetyltransferase n=1 Tax=Raineyella antarctica TaxID=1577474 RepID=A0A1G6IDT0_9ACTN|nr:acetyl-CoA C-acetyltransferase [Raineyella antarctica]SDC04165.1 acetyl-CoA C-acetyltransferase [Raineyella antarctica]